MARIWQGGAELESTTAGVEVSAQLSNYPAIETTIKRSGNAAWRISNAAAAEGIRVACTTAQAVYYYRFYINVQAMPTTTSIIGGYRINGAAKLSIRLTSAGLLQFFNTEDATQIGSDSSAISTGTWYRIEVEMDDTTLASVATSARAYTDTPGNTSPFWNPSGTANLAAAPNNITWGNPTSDATLDFIVDDVAVNDSSGDIQNSWCGEGGIIHQKPDGAGDNSDWTRGGADSGANWSQVNETTPNDATNYVQSNTSGQIDDYTLDATPAALESDDVINVVMVGARVAVSDAASADPDYVLRIKDSPGGTVEESDTLDVNSIAWGSPARPGNPAEPYVYRLVLYDLPGASTGTWTKATLDTAQIGIREAVTDAHFVQVSTIWLSVDYKPGSGGGTTPISGSDTLSLSITDTASVVVAVSPSDTLSLSLTEFSSTVVAVAPSDSLSLSLTESASVVVIAEPSDTLSLSLTESASINVVIDVADTLTLSLTEASALEASATYSVSDSLSLGLTETLDIVVSVAVSDSLSLSLTENGSPAVSVNPNDDTTISLTEASSVVVSVAPADTLSLSLTESGAITLSNEVLVSDTLTISITEAASVEIAQAVSTSDTLSLSLMEMAQVVVSVSVIDSVSISITDTATSYGEGNPSDTTGISLTESASVVVSVSVSDTLSISLTESATIDITTLTIPISGSDTLTLSLAEMAIIVAVTPPVVSAVRGQLSIYDCYSTTLGAEDRTVSMLSIDDSRLYNIVVGDE